MVVQFLALVENTTTNTLETNELDKETRRFLLGERATIREWCLKVVELTVGNPTKGIRPKSQQEVGDQLGISRQWVANYIKISLKHGLAEQDPNNPDKIKIPEQKQTEFKEYFELYAILQDPLVQAWDNSNAFKKDGEPIKARQLHVRNLQKFCNALKVKPIQLLQDRETTGKYLEIYLSKLRDGTIPRRSLRKNSSPEQAFKSVKDAVAHFCMYNNVSIPKGTGGIWSRKVMGHGQYADIRLTDSQLERLDELLIQNYGIDSNIYRLIWVGIESGARKEALLKMNLDWAESENEDGSITFFMTAYESKTSHIKGGKWTKYITRKKTQESLRLLKSRNGTLLFENETKSKMYKVLLRELKKIYTALGLSHWYFEEHPVHALRHISAQYWLAHTNYDYDYVCMVCGWHTNAELKASYGEMPPDVIARKLRQYTKIMANVGATS